MLCFLSQICQKFPLAEEGGCYSDGRDIFEAEHAEKTLFYHLSQASHKGLTGAHMGKDRPGATWGKHLDRLVSRLVSRALGKFGADLSYKLPPS